MAGSWCSPRTSVGIRRGPPCQALRFNQLTSLFQGLKLRRHRGKLWPAPIPLSRLRLLQYHDVGPVSPLQLTRMVSVPCNDSMVHGYSACWLAGSPIYIHAHRGGEDMSFYNIVESDAIWMHMPTEPSEFISSIWLRKGSIEDELDRSLMVGEHLCQRFKAQFLTLL